MTTEPHKRNSVTRFRSFLFPGHCRFIKMSDPTYDGELPMYKVFKEYFDTETEAPSLAGFYAHNPTFFMSNCHSKSVIATWKGRFTTACRTAGVKKSSRKQPDWTEILQKLLPGDDVDEEPEAEVAPSTPTEKKATESTPTTPTTKRSRTSSDSSKSDSCLLTEYAKNKFKEAFENMEDEKKWLVKEDEKGNKVYLENIMFEVGKDFKHEHLVHSFIFDPTAACWKKHLSQDELMSLCNFQNTPNPPLDQTLLDIFDKCTESVSELDNISDDDNTKADAIIDAIWRSINDKGYFDPRTHYDEDWVQRSLLDYLHLYRLHKVEEIKSHGSEMDFVVRFWSNLDKCFDNISVAARDRTCMSTLIRVNSERGVTGTTQIDEQHRSVRPDLLIIKDGLELACGECGREDLGGVGKKELVERNLHVPKVMKDMFLRSLLKGKNAESLARKLKVVAMNQNSTRMQVSVMDSPNGYICRLLHFDEYELPVDPALITFDLFDIMKTTLLAKAIVKESVAQIKKHQKLKQRGVIPTYSFNSQRTTTIPQLSLPPSLTFSNKKQKKA